MNFTIVEGLTVEEIGQVPGGPGRVRIRGPVPGDLPHGRGHRGGLFIIQDVVDANDEGRAYVLEGYLYPDTYEIYVGSSEETVIGRMLDRMNVIYGVAYRTRAEELGMDMDEVITLASMIEREGKADSFDKVSAVFHNRLDAGMALGSDVTVQYALGVRRLVLTQEELAVDSAYNTYQHTGLPVGATSPRQRGHRGGSSIPTAIMWQEDTSTSS